MRWARNPKSKAMGNCIRDSMVSEACFRMVNSAIIMAAGVAYPAMMEEMIANDKRRDNGDGVA